MLQLTANFPGKRAFITGAGSGLGQALSLLLAEDKWTIGICDINQNNLDKTASAIKALGGEAYPYQLDVSDKNRYQEVALSFLKTTDGIDLLVNNAGVGDGGSFHQYSLDNWEWLLSINLMGVVHGCHFFMPSFRRQKSGHIINIASIAGIINGPSMSAYNASKAAVISLSETLYYELHPHSVAVSVVMPSFFKTKVLQHARGPKQALEMAQKLVDNSNLEVEPVAREILTKAGQGKLHIILPKSARNRVLMKRFFPAFFRKQLINIVYKMRAKRGERSKGN